MGGPKSSPTFLNAAIYTSLFAYLAVITYPML